MKDYWNGILDIDRSEYHAKNPEKYYFVIKEDLDPRWHHTGIVSSVPYQKGKYLLKKPGDKNKKGNTYKFTFFNDDTEDTVFNLNFYKRMELFGPLFEEGKIEIVSPDKKEEEKVVEEVEEVEVEVEEGVFYDFRLGDCLESLKLQKDNSIDIVVTSPPYNIGLKYHKYEDKKPREQYLEWSYDIFVELKRVLRDNGHIFLNMGYTNKDPWISMEVALKLKDLLVMQNKITWVKSISIGEDKDDTYGHFKPINSDRYINVTNEDIYHFTKTDNVKINREAVGVPYKWKCNLIDRKTKQPRIDKKTGEPVKDQRCKGNSWFIPYDTIWSKSQKGFHPATFPEGLVEHCIKISDVKEGVILDPFIGSGTTVRTAKKMTDTIEEYKLSGIGYDIDEKYIQYCEESIHNK